MRHKLSITLDEDTLLRINDTLRSKIYRNKSHVIEVALSNLFGDSDE